MIVPRAQRRLRLILVQHAIQNGDLRFQILREELGRLVPRSEEIDVDAPQGVVQEVCVCKHTADLKEVCTFVKHEGLFFACSRRKHLFGSIHALSSVCRFAPSPRDYIYLANRAHVRVATLVGLDNLALH